VNARNRVFLILGILTAGSLIWYFATVHTSGDMLLIGTVDANEVLVSSKIPGRIQTLTVDEGQQVQAGQLIAVIESDDLQAARNAAEATANNTSWAKPSRLSARPAAKPAAPLSTPRRS
jgi:multidrug efflux pump subunit AcrA (membrane-fusion protein)